MNSQMLAYAFGASTTKRLTCDKLQPALFRRVALVDGYSKRRRAIRASAP